MDQLTIHQAAVWFLFFVLGYTGGIATVWAALKDEMYRIRQK